MRMIGGRIQNLLTNAASEVSGIVLDNGQAVMFPPEKAGEVLSIVTLGSHVEIETFTPSCVAGNSPVHAATITDLRSHKSFFFNVNPTETPEVCADVYPPPGTASAPLAPTFEMPAAECGKRARAAIAERVIDAIERAYDRLHRSQVLLAFLKSATREKSTVLQYLHEAKRTYAQALSRYQARDFEGARECAAAAYDLAEIAEILISRTFHSPAHQPTSGPPAIESVPVPENFKAAAVNNNLHRIDTLLGRVRWVTKNGTLPSEDRDQVQKLVSWSDNLKRWARRLLDVGAGDEASEFAHAAAAAADAAEHVCKKCYVTRRADPRASSAAG